MMTAQELDAVRERLAKATVPLSMPGYVISEDGEVWSVSSNWRGYGCRKLAAIPNSHGYLRVRMLLNNGVRKSFFVHKLVAEAYLPPRPTKNHEIRHLDGTRTNNKSSNLMWGTRSENAADREKHGKTARGSNNGVSKLTEDAVLTILKDYENGVSTTDLAIQYGVSTTSIRMAINNKQWKHVHDLRRAAEAAGREGE
jgi:hypothetical protein